jgi:transposase
VRARTSDLAAQYHRVARRRGGKKAIAAVAHSILVAVWHILRHGVPYRDPGRDHFDRLASIFTLPKGLTCGGRSQGISNRS